MFAGVCDDLRYAVRSLRRTPAFAAAAIATLALGIGATTSVFSTVYGVLLRPLPYPEADRLVRLSEGYEGATPLRPGSVLGSVTYHAWKEFESQVVDAIEGYTEAADVVLISGDRRQLVQLSRVTPGLFRLLGVTPLRGRLFVDGDGAAGQESVLVLGARVWRERFGADPEIVGNTVALGGQPYTVIGVADPEFAFPNRQTELWGIVTVPQPTGPVSNPAFSTLFAIGHLKPGATAAQVSAEGTTVARRRDPKPLAARLTFGDGGPAIVRARPMVNEMTASVQGGLVVVAAGVGCILLLVCVNVANLLLSRGAARHRELAVRTAVGAGRWRLARQLLTESMVLSGCGAAIGITIAFWAVAAAALLAPADFPRLDDIAIDVHSLVVALLVSTLTAIVSAVPAILHATHGSPFVALHSRVNGVTSRAFRGEWMRSSLLAAEASCAVVILVAALLLGRSFVRLLHVDAGYTPNNVLILSVFRPGTDDTSAKRYGPLMTAALERIRATPGVDAAGIGSPTPLDDNNQLAAFPIPGSLSSQQLVDPTAQQAQRTALARSYRISLGFERALGLRLRAGRFFTEADRIGDDVRWIVNEEFARLYLPSDPVGRRFPWSRRGRPLQLEIVGVVGNVLKNGNSEAPRPEIYGLIGDTDPFYNSALVVRTDRDATAYAPALRAIMRDVAPDAVVDVASLSDRVSESFAQSRFATAVFGALALVASLLTAVGVFAVLSYRLAQRTREFGVRVAIGATRGHLVRMVLRDGTAPTIVGIVIGLGAAVAVTRLMHGVLFGISPLDAVSFAMGPILLIPVALVAYVVPALRASRVDPMTALRAE